MYLQCPWAYRHNEEHRIQWLPYVWTISAASRHLGCNLTPHHGLWVIEDPGIHSFYLFLYQMYCSLASSAVYLLLSGTSILFYPWANCPAHFFTEMIDLLLGVLLGWNLLILTDINLNTCIFERLCDYLRETCRESRFFFVFFLHIGQVLGYLNLFETRTD